MAEQLVELKWKKLDEKILSFTEQSWLDLLYSYGEDQDVVSPDKYEMYLSYAKSIASGTARSHGADSNGYIYGLVNNAGIAQAIVHIVHARPRSVEGGWVKVLSTRLAPDFDVDLRADISDEKYTAILEGVGDLVSKVMLELISLTRSLEATKFKYYASNELDERTLKNLADDIKKSKAGQKLKVTAARKGKWIEVDV